MIEFKVTRRVGNAEITVMHRDAIHDLLGCHVEVKTNALEFSGYVSEIGTRIKGHSKATFGGVGDRHLGEVVSEITVESSGQAVTVSLDRIQEIWVR
jgi:hypothetical protein